MMAAASIPRWRRRGRRRLRRGIADAIGRVAPLGGRIATLSGMPRGAAFALTLPLPGRQSRGSGCEGPPAGNDDDGALSRRRNYSSVVRKVSSAASEDLDFTVSEAEDGETALTLCRDSMPDAILVDATMPMMDGIDFVKALRRLEGGMRPKILFCMTEYNPAVVGRAVRAGADDHVLKPFDRSVIEAKLQEWASCETLARRRCAPPRAPRPRRAGHRLRRG